jgi:hypothetical protein
VNDVGQFGAIPSAAWLEATWVVMAGSEDAFWPVPEFLGKYQEL